jgi:DNA modification methylase
MQIIQRQTKELIPAEYNPRQIDKDAFEQLKASLESFECVEPAVININPDRLNIIVGGHQRIKAAKALKWKEFPCIEVDLPLEREKELNVRLNKNTGEFDFDLLANHFEVDDLVDWGFDESEFGMDVEEIGEATNKGSLSDSFGIPPFSVLNAREGWWQDRKHGWLAIGLKSELGRDIDPTNVGKNAPDYMAGRGNNEGGSIFDPVLCELAYRWFSPKGGLVLDPFAGGSVRGIVAAELGREYIGVDLRDEQVEANKKQATEVCKDVVPAWIMGDSLDIDKHCKGVKADMLFTCPPYADLEVYSDDPKDLSTMAYKEFAFVYAEIIRKSCELLKDNTFACIVVGEVRDKKGNYYNFVGDTIQAFIDAGLNYYNEAILVTCVGSLPIRAGKQFKAGRKLGKTHQNILVFVKGDGKKATQNCGDVDFAEMKEDEEGLI